MKALTPLALIVLALAAVVWLDDTPLDADLVFVNQNEVFTLDPQRMSYLQDLRLAHVLYEGLVRWDNSDFSIVPAAAVRLPDVSDDGLRFTFEIRPDARWSTNHPVTAHDFIYAWQRAILPDSAADYSNLFFAIEGAEAFFEWRLERTSDFVSDPWDESDAKAAHRLARRLGTLLDAPDLPESLEPDPRTEDDLRRELALLAALPDDGEAAAVLATARAVRDWDTRLRATDTRPLEAKWWWDETQRHFEKVVGLRAINDLTLEITLRQPTAYLLDLLCFGVFFPVHRPTVEGWDPAAVPPTGWHDTTPPPFANRRWVRISPKTGKLEQKHEWAKPGRHVGNGTHILEQWRYKRDLRLERNPFYHDQDRITVDSILARTIEDVNTAFLAFESGEVDWLADVDVEYQADLVDERRAYEARYAEQLETLLDAGRSLDEALAELPAPDAGERRNVHCFPTFGTDFYNFNCRPTLPNGRPNPFADAHVRRAFTLAVDKQVIVDRVTRLSEPVATTLIPPGSIRFYNSPAGLPHDVERARAELAAAGWEDRNGDGLVEDANLVPFPTVDLLYTTNTPRYKWISLNLKDQWERALGVQVDLRGEETKFYKEDLKLGHFMIARGRWYGDYGDPTTFLDLCKSTDGNNDRKFNNPEVDDLLERAMDERDPQTRLRLLEECERRLVEEDLPILPICQLVQVYAYEPGRVRGLSQHPRLVQFLWQMDVSER